MFGARDGQRRRHHRYGRGHARGHHGIETTLDRVRSGEQIEIVGVDDDIARAQAIRLGISEGAPVTCVTKLPCGPVILKCGLQEIAVGRGLAQRICIRRQERVSDDGAL